MKKSQVNAEVPAAPNTKEAILAAAMELFCEKGFEGTTMREIAEKAGVATGAAYYYFKTKEEIVLAFYVESCEEFRQKGAAVFSSTKSFAKRLEKVLDARFEQLLPYRPCLGALLRVSVDPDSELSPFNDRSSETKDKAIQIFRDAVAGSDLKVQEAVARHLPWLLWLYHMGVVFFWIHDRTPQQAKTKKLVKATSAIMLKILSLSRLPVVRGLLTPAIKFLDEMAAM